MAKSVQTRESSLEEHSQTKVYYYSKFELFAQDSQLEFQQFAIFGERLRVELGADWAAEAGLLYDPYLSGKQVFIHLLELWLRHHPPVNSMRPLQKASTFNPQFIADFDALIRGQSGRIPKNATVKPAASSLRAVCLGFYMTANEIWEELFQGQSMGKQSNPFQGGFLKGVTNTLEKTFQPLMVVTQQITSVFGRKRRKLNEERQQMRAEVREDEEDGEMRLEDCYPCFRKALNMQKQLERKMSDFDLDDLQPQSQQRQVHKSPFFQEDSPLQSTLVSHLYSYVTDFLHRNPSWQVASNFVTQILDLNQVQLQEGQKVKVLRPAQEFYRRLMIVWLLCHQDCPVVGFEDYLSALRSSFFAEGWEARFVQPTKYFFEKMRASWEGDKTSWQGDRGKLDGFISKVQGCVGADWNAKIAARGC